MRRLGPKPEHKAMEDLMASRCPDCTKFVSLETADPEVELSVDDNRVSVQVRVVRTCADCGTELKESTFDADEELDLPVVEGHDHELEVEELSSNSTETGGGRYKKNMIGYEVEYRATCSCGYEHTGQFRDELQASAYDELT